VEFLIGLGFFGDKMVAIVIAAAGRNNAMIKKMPTYSQSLSIISPRVRYTGDREQPESRN
jgi:hypothetical protein